MDKTTITQTSEAALLSSILLDPAILPDVRATVPPDNFLDTRNKNAYAALCAVADASQVIDVVSVANAMPGDRMKNLLYLNELIDLVITASAWRTHAKSLSDAAIRAKVQRLAHTLVELATDRESPVAGLIDTAQTGLVDLQRALVGDSAPVAKLSGVISDVLRDIEHRLANNIKGVRTGFYALDDMTDGLMPGQLWVISAYTSRGKSIFSEQLAVKAAEQGAGVLFTTLEMSARSSGQRIISRTAGVSAQLIRRGILGTDEKTKIADAISKLNQLPLYIYDRDNLQLPKILNQARLMHLQADIKVLVVDYLQLVQVPSVKADNVRERVSQACSAFKSLAKDLGIIVILVSQQSRPYERDPSKEPEPTIFGLKESGSIEQDADTILLLCRPEFFGRENFEKALVKLAKQREGPAPVDIDLVFDRNRVRWLNPGDAYLNQMQTAPKVSLDSEAGEG
jgi:replicative DNA helicase